MKTRKITDMLSTADKVAAVMHGHIPEPKTFQGWLRERLGLSPILWEDGGYAVLSLTKLTRPRTVLYGHEDVLKFHHARASGVAALNGVTALKEANGRVWIGDGLPLDSLTNVCASYGVTQFAAAGRLVSFGNFEWVAIPVKDGYPG